MESLVGRLDTRVGRVPTPSPLPPPLFFSYLVGGRGTDFSLYLLPPPVLEQSKGRRGKTRQSHGTRGLYM